jgi:Holliday junction resolvasome RuvABC endonuclease subunit
MVRVLLGLDQAPTPHDAADAVAIAICHLHHVGSGASQRALAAAPARPRSWRQMRESDLRL